MKYIMFLITVRVLIPMASVTYKDVVSYQTNRQGSAYILSLKDGSYAVVPLMFTIIEEK
jgi:hypothetical protein